jgi:SAM-dependent methyltransferase
MTVELQTRPAAFRPVGGCWICGATGLSRFHQCRLDFLQYALQDPELAEYTNHDVWLVRCGTCGFAQPEELPVLPRFFERVYDQRWSDEWIDREFEAQYKDLIFSTILRNIEQRVRPGASRQLLDVGAHVGRFMSLAQAAGWIVEGLEVNPKTAACAERRTGGMVHRTDLTAIAAADHRFTAVTIIDVLEHIPHPVQVLSQAARLLAPGGVVAVKVPSGPAQWWKERLLASLNRSRRVSLADNLVHVNHFSPRSLRAALEQAGFREITIAPGAPELRCDGTALGRQAANLLRLAVYQAARLPGAIRTPLALNLQAYATTPS